MKLKELPTEFKSLKNIRTASEDDEYNVYRADFGRDGGVTWEVADGFVDDGIVSALTILSMNRHKNQEYADKSGSRGEGIKALADIFNLYPTVKSFLYEDESDFGFWDKIGGDVDELSRDKFFKYYNNRTQSISESYITNTNRLLG